jgi:hypothetical protein
MFLKMPKCSDSLLVSAWVVVSCLIPSGSFAESSHDLSKFIKDCSRPGNTLLAVSERVIDLNQLIPSADDTHPFCIREYSCSIPSENIMNYKGQVACGLKRGGVCESLAECGQNLTKNVDFGFTPPQLKAEVGYVPKTGRRCEELKRNSDGMVYSMFLNPRTENDYRTLCVKSIKCRMPSGIEEVYSQLACPSTGRKVKMADGSMNDECYGPNECFDKQLPLPSEQEYREYLSNKLKLASEKISATQPRNSQTVSEPAASTPSEPNHKRGP